MNIRAHHSLGQHYFLDALDLHERFRLHWEDQPRKSSRVKSFIDLLMSAECMLKSQCIMARLDAPIVMAYAEVKQLGHSIEKLSHSAHRAFPSSTHARVRQYFGSFDVGLRYSVDAHEYFFPVGGSQQAGRRSYRCTLGDTNWINLAESVVQELIEWGKLEFNGLVEDDIETVLLCDGELESVIQSTKARQRRKKGDA